MTALAALYTPDARRSIARAASIAGIAGVVVIIVAIAITAFGYHGALNEPYNFGNHFVSELGEVGISDLAIIFNISLILGGLCFIVFMLGVAHFMSNWYGVIFAIVGLLMGINGVLVGIFPMNNLAPHIRVAMNFFYLGLGSMALFSIYVIIFRKRDLPLWLLIPGVLTGFAFFAFLFLTEPLDTSGDLLSATRMFVLHRPAVSQTALIEWIVMLSILLWVMVVSLFLQTWLRRSTTAPRP